MTETLKLEIKGEPYHLSRNEWGWEVAATSSPTDRFHRSYQVVVGGDGEPKSCSCPHQRHRGGLCKHMEAVTQLLKLDMTPA